MSRGPSPKTRYAMWTSPLLAYRTSASIRAARIYRRRKAHDRASLPSRLQVCWAAAPAVADARGSAALPPEVLAIVVDGVGSEDITALRSGCLLRHRFCGLSDHVEHKVGLGQHRNVAAVGLEGVRSHTLCDETLQGGLDGTVTAGNDVPARFRSPSCAVYLLIEQVCRGRCMRGPNEFLLLFW